MKLNCVSAVALLVTLFVVGAAQIQFRPSSKYRRPAIEDGLFHVQRHGGIVMDPEDGFDPRALVLSYDNNPINPKSGYLDAPTSPGFYLSSVARFDFERIQVSGTKVYFKTRTIAGVYYQFYGFIGSERIGPARTSRLYFIKGILTRFNERRVMSQEEIKFVHA